MLQQAWETWTIQVVFDKHQVEFETLDSNTDKGIMKIVTPADFKRNINFSKWTQYKNKCPLLTDRQIKNQIFSFFNLSKTEAHTMNLNELLDVGLYSDNLKMFNQAWEETLLPLG